MKALLALKEINPVEILLILAFVFLVMGLSIPGMVAVQ